MIGFLRLRVTTMPVAVLSTLYPKDLRFEQNTNKRRGLRDFEQESCIAAVCVNPNLQIWPMTPFKVKSLF